MAELLRFFRRQTLVGDATGSSYYSDVFDVTEYSHITLALRVYENSVGGANTVTAILQETSDPTLTGAWEALETIQTLSGAPDVVMGRASHPLRFVRVNIRLPPAACRVTLLCDGVAREGV
jgi:hypothetical protein